MRSGEFYVAYFSDCVLDDEIVDAIGIFKSENKDTYLKPIERNNPTKSNKKPNLIKGTCFAINKLFDCKICRSANGKKRVKLFIGIPYFLC